MNKHPNRLWISALALGLLFDYLFWKKSPGLNFAVFSALCLLGGYCLLLAEGLRPASKSLLLVVPFAFFVVITFFREEPLTLFLAYAITVVSLGLLASTYLGGRWMQYSLSDYFNRAGGLLRSMFARPPAFFTDVRRERAERGDKNSGLRLWSLLRGLLIAVPIVACFASLLASGDVVFNQKLADFFRHFTRDKIIEDSLRLLLILVCAYLAAGTFLHAAAQSRDEKLLGEEEPVIRPILGFTESAVVLSSVAVLFIIFVSVQFRYFFGGQANIGVEGYTYSQYARRGFNELVTVAFFSLLMIIGLSTLTRRENNSQRRGFSGLIAAIVALVLVILVSAYQRLSLAIDWHGFSRLRLYPRVFLIWVGVLLVAIAVLEILRRERYFGLAFLLASLGFAASLTLVNVDAAIVKHNVPRVLQGKNLNVPHLASLSEDAVPALLEEFRSPGLPRPAREGVGAVLMCYLYADANSGHSTGDWQSFSVSHQQADLALRRALIDLQGYRFRDKMSALWVRTPGGVLYECQESSPIPEED
jgi:uncharacterized protein DUF4153